MFIENYRKVCGYSVSDQSGAQEEYELQKWVESPIEVDITCHICVYRIRYTVIRPMY